MVIIASQTKSPTADAIEGLLVTSAGLDTSEGGMCVAATGIHTDMCVVATGIHTDMCVAATGIHTDVCRSYWHPY